MNDKLATSLWTYLAYKKTHDQARMNNQTKVEAMWKEYQAQAKAQTGGGGRRKSPTKSLDKKSTKNNKKIWCGAGVYILDNRIQTKTVTIKDKKAKGGKRKVKKKVVTPCMVVFMERNRSRWSGHDVYEEPGGKLEPTAKSIAHGAQAELREESRNLFNISPRVLNKKFKNGDSRFIDVWTGNKAFRAYALCLNGFPKGDYDDNVNLLEFNAKTNFGPEVPWCWRETLGTRWIPLSEFSKKKIRRVDRKSWGGKVDHRAVVKDLYRRDTEIGGRLISGIKRYGGLALCRRVLKEGPCYDVSQLKDQSAKQKGFLKGTINYAL